ncbi:hypothetical protein SKAU_G00181710 [Synaphobranchus kaupii]|uniref:Uncharacterized protein n=1 Tax=Synaphobranchus kaupii TaxID=118154 RepID=A0A9Q1FML4_SYNKA|nr:hypothetical protein SKAU_G00181710 [Synaphobranchus kaupii]
MAGAPTGLEGALGVDLTGLGSVTVGGASAAVLWSRGRLWSMCCLRPIRFVCVSRSWLGHSEVNPVTSVQGAINIHQIRSRCNPAKAGPRLSNGQCYHPGRGFIRTVSPTSSSGKSRADLS